MGQCEAGLPWRVPEHFRGGTERGEKTNKKKTVNNLHLSELTYVRGMGGSVTHKRERGERIWCRKVVKGWQWPFQKGYKSAHSLFECRFSTLTMIKSEYCSGLQVEDDLCLLLFAVHSGISCLCSCFYALWGEAHSLRLWKPCSKLQSFFKNPVGKSCFVCTEYKQP